MNSYISMSELSYIPMLAFTFNSFDTYIVGMIGKIFKIILTSFLLGDYLYTQHNTVQIFCAFYYKKQFHLYLQSIVKVLNSFLKFIFLVLNNLIFKGGFYYGILWKNQKDCIWNKQLLQEGLNIYD